MNAHQYWQRHNERSAIVGNLAMMPVAMLRPVPIHHVLPIPTLSMSSLRMYYCTLYILL
jgi:hypothetical protein